MSKVYSMICNCFSKVACACASFWAAPSRNHHMQISQRDLKEWKRIEGIDQYAITKRPWS